MKVNTFPELTGILFPEQCETSGGYCHMYKLEKAMLFPTQVSENPPREPSIPPQETKR